MPPKPAAIETVLGPLSNDYNRISKGASYTKLQCFGVASGVPVSEYILAFHVSGTRSLRKGRRFSPGVIMAMNLVHLRTIQHYPARPPVCSGDNSTAFERPFETFKEK